MSDLIRLSKSVVGKEEANALAEVILNDGMLGMGQYVQNFENQIKKFFDDKKEICCVNTGTAALHLAVASVVSPGEEVLVQSLTYLASFQAISAANAIPISCEINESNATIDLDDAKSKITEKTKAIMPVHYAGNCGSLDEIYKFAEQYNLRVIEDAAHAFGTTYQGKKIGTFGDIICFSFDGIKNITSGEGGAIVTSDPHVIKYAQDARLLGIHNDTDKRYKGLRSWEFDVTNQGYRYHMSNLFGAIGIEQLKKFSIFKKQRQSLSKRYDKYLKDLPGLILFGFNYNYVVPHIYPIRVLNGKRDQLRKFLLKENIQSGVHYYPNHFLSMYNNPSISLPITEKIYNELLSLPLHPDVEIEDQDRVLNLIKEFLKGK